MTTTNPFDTQTDDSGFDFGSPDPIENPFIEPDPIFPNEPIISQPIKEQHFQKDYVKKYNIVDLYWLVNQKLFNSQKLNKDEVALLIIGYNTDFNNLRISFHEANAKSFTQTSILKYETKQIATINLFSETAQKILYNVQTKKFKDEVSNFERLFSPNVGNNDWKPNPSQITLDIPNNIILQTKYNNTLYSFTLLDWQIQAFLNAMKFMTDGSAWKSSLLKS